MDFRTASKIDVLAVILALGWISGCGDDSDNSNESDTTTQQHDTASATDASVDDTSTSTSDDVPTTSDDTADIITAPACEFPSPRLSDTPEAQALISASAARCGQEPYVWLDEPRLGEIIDYGVTQRFNAATLNALAAAQGITLPKPLTHSVVVIQFSYYTQAKGELVEATSLVALPSDLGPETPPQPMLIGLHATLGFSDQCAPSLTLEAQAFAALFAGFGYVVVSPDYIGLKGMGEPTGFLHPYMVGEPTAMASLDALRAVGRLPAEHRRNVCPMPEFLVVGASQGGHGALWMDRIAPYYAPELSMLGIVSIVPPSDLLAQAQHSLQSLTPATSNTIWLATAQAAWYGALDKLSEVLLPPFDTTAEQLVNDACVPEDIIEPLTSPADAFTPSLLQAATDGLLGQLDPWGCFASENSLLTTSIPRASDFLDTYSVLFVLGSDDEIVNTPIERSAFQRLCDEQNMPLQFLECEGADHVKTITYALPELLTFVEDRLARKPLVLADVCAIQAPIRCQGTPP